MKFWMLVGLATVATIAAVPTANAAERTIECETETARRAEERVDPPPLSAVPGATRATPTMQQQQQAAPAAVTPTPSVRQTERRRSGSRKRALPDAVLIGPRGAL